ncbi:MAG: hypothetical protein LBK53_06350 [Heliobacteriaceae bacterium]|nr:hypothetical protein [Heliobacteriaceae bacterium]
MCNAIASIIFAGRNYDKTKSGEVGRAPVFLFQTAKVVDAALKYDSKIAKNAVSVFNRLAGQSKVLDYTGKALKWGMNNINPLICASGGLKTLMSDDKLTTGITETGALATMFAGEAVMKCIVNSSAVKNSIQKASKLKLLKPLFNFIKKGKFGGKAAAILKGAAFVAASVSAYSLGHYLASDVAKEINSSLGRNVQKSEKSPKTYA